MRTKIEAPQPIVYVVGHEFETLNYIDLNHKSDILGYKLSFDRFSSFPYILTDIIVVSKCGIPNLLADLHASITGIRSGRSNQGYMRELAQCVKLNGKSGNLLPIELLSIWKIVKQQIKEMDKFLLGNGIDAEQDYKGEFWFDEILDWDGRCGYYFDTENKILNKNAYSVFEGGTLGCKEAYDVDDTKTRLLISFFDEIPAKHDNSPKYWP